MDGCLLKYGGHYELLLGHTRTIFQWTVIRGYNVATLVMFAGS